MQEVIKFEVDSVNHTKEARTASLKRVGDRACMFARMQLDVPVEVPCDPGDSVTLTVEWA